LKVSDLIKRRYGEEHVENARSLQNLCVTLERLGEFEKAKEGYLKALEIFKKYYGEDHIDYATTL
jgi:tetratricopeptide (TPR) repeat protein